MLSVASFFASRRVLQSVIPLLAFLCFLAQTQVHGQTAEVIREGDTWRTVVDGTRVHTGDNMTHAVNAAANWMGNGPGTINVRDSGVADVFWGMQLRVGQTLDFHGNTVHSATNVIPIYGDRRGDITIRNVRMTGAPRYGIWFRGGSNIHLHNIRMHLSRGSLGLGIRVDNHSDHGIPTYNLKMTGEIFVEGARHHAVEISGIDGVEIERITTRYSAGSGLQLNGVRNARIGTIDAYRAAYGGGYAGLRVANGSGPNIHVEKLFARECGRGFFSLSGSQGTTVDFVEIFGCSGLGIWIEDTPDTRVLSGYLWDNGAPYSVGGEGSFIEIKEEPPPHEFVTHPSSQVVVQGEEAVFQVSTVDPEGLGLEWYFSNDLTVRDSDTLVGTGPTLSISSVQSSHQGFYYCKVVNPDLGVTRHSRFAGLWLADLLPWTEGSTLTWTGASNAHWDQSTPNWATDEGPAWFWPEGVQVRFDDSSYVSNVMLQGTLRPEEVLVDASQNYAFEGPGEIGGAATLVKTGPGTLTMHRENSYSGGTIVAGGTLAQAWGTADFVSFGSGQITLRGGTLAMWDRHQVHNSQTYHLVVPDGETGVLHADARCAIHGTLSGGGTLRMRVPWIRTDLHADWSAFEGRLELFPIEEGSGHLRMARNYDFPGFPDTAVDLAAGVSLYYTGTLNPGGTTVPIGALSGEQGSRLLGGPTGSGGRPLTYRVGGLDTDAVFAGDIRETEESSFTNMSIIKTGTGTWILSGENAWNGSMIVEQGRLVVSGAVEIGRELSIDEGAELVLTESGSIAAGESLTNDGVLRIHGSPELDVDGPFVNNGVLDLIRSTWTPPDGFQNNGRILRAGDVRTSMEKASDATVRIRFHAYPGHTYQLQKTYELSDPDWSDVPDAFLAPETKKEAVFEISDSGEPKRFFRVIIGAETF